MYQWSGHHTTDADTDCENTQIHAAMTTARTFWRNPEKFALLTIYEQRISRKVQRNEERLRALQSDRNQQEREAAEAHKGAAATPKPKPATRAASATASDTLNGFDCSSPESAPPPAPNAPKPTGRAA